MPRPLSPENAPIPPDTSEIGAFSSGETGSEEHPTKPDGPPPSPDDYPKSPDNDPTSSALYPLSLDKEADLLDNHPKSPDASQLSSDDYRTSSDAYLIASDKEETKKGSYLFSSDKEQTKIGKGELSSDKEETQKGSYLFASDKEQTELGREAEEKGKEENPSAPLENRPAPVMRGRRTLPSSPVERARLEAQSGVQQNELNDRSTQVAFALLFVVPILIILMAVLLLLPFISRQMNDDDPSGVRVQPSANGQLPSR